jgi:DNA-binding phage protein
MAPNQIAQLVRKLLVVDRSVPKARLAIKAGLSTNALNQVDDETWNPTLRTLNKLEAYLIMKGYADD